MEDKFNFLVDAEVDIIKSEKEGQRIIRGYASTPDEDRQGEILVQKGLDISYFVNHGWFNYDHDNSIILGYPTENTHIDERGLWVEGVLLKGVPLADRIWNLAVALKKSNAPRKLGFSVEGKVLERDGNRIVKAVIYNCAITPRPVNTNATWEAVVKSFRPDADDYILNKSLEAGYATSPETQEDGGALREESLERAVKVLAEKLDDEEAWKKYRSFLIANGGKFTKSEAIVYLQLHKGLSRKQATELVNSFQY